MNVGYFLLRLWEWLIHHGLPIAALVVVAILIPRIGRFAVRIITQRFTKEEEATKTRLALVGALVYVVEAVAYFFVIMIILTNLGVPPLGAALPATVVSAAVGFGAQNVIGDFLAGFFIISERQFGLGDYVSFDGPNNPVEGTVVALTLRATRLRTPAGEMVNVPNGSTGVITNYSQEWSRAVVDIQIPMEPGETMSVLTKKVAAAAHKAVEKPEIAKDITNDLDVLPATQLIQPTTAGQPWSVQYRITVDVNPARQWAVERAIRAAVANVFWDRMQQSRGFSAVEPDATSTHTPTQPSKSEKDSLAHTRRTGLAAGTLAGAGTAGAGTVAAAQEAHADESGEHTAEFSAMSLDTGSALSSPTGEEAKTPNEELLAADDGPGAPAFKESGSDIDDPQSTKKDPYDADGVRVEDEGFESWFQRHEYDTKIKNFLSVGGRTRVSTTVLFLTLLVLGGLALASSNPEGGNAGFLNPARWQSTAEENTGEETETTDVPATGDGTTTTDNMPQDTTQDGNQQPTGEQQPQQSQEPRQDSGATAPRETNNAPTSQQTEQPSAPETAGEPQTPAASEETAG